MSKEVFRITPDEIVRLINDTYLAGRRKTLAELKEAFEAGREHEPKKAESGYWMQFYTWDNFDDWYETRGEKL